MYHWRDGWYFRREIDGSVSVLRDSGEGPSLLINIPADEWASIVHAVARWPADFYRAQAATAPTAPTEQQSPDRERWGRERASYGPLSILNVVAQLEHVRERIHDVLDDERGGCLKGFNPGCGFCELCLFDEAVEPMKKILAEKATRELAAYVGAVRGLPKVEGK